MTPEGLAAATLDIAKALRLMFVEERVGFIVVLSQFEPGRELSYASSCDRDDCVRCLRELVQHLQGDDDDAFLDALIAERERARPGFVGRVAAALERHRQAIA